VNYLYIRSIEKKTMVRFCKLEIMENETIIKIPLGFNGGHQLRAYLSPKKAGDMAFSKQDILPYRKNFFRTYGIDKSRIFSLYQKHTKEIVNIPERALPEDYHNIVADGMITRGKSNVLSITVADCLPIFLIDTSGKGFGILHSGWKGTGIVLNGIDALKHECGSIQKDIRVVIGPGIGSCCYNVEKERFIQFTAMYGADAGRNENGKYYIDLKKANTTILEEHGVNDITIIEDCTSCNFHLSSFRRDGEESLNLMLALIGYIEGNINV
jgi:YfiH family protein